MSSRSSASTGFLVAAFGAAGVLGSLWLPWYLIRLPEAFRELFAGLAGAGAQQGAATAAPAGNPGAQLGEAMGALFKGVAAAMPTEISGTGWEVMRGGDVALAIVAGIALLIALAVSGGLNGVNVERAAAGRLVAALGAVAVAVAVYHAFKRPGSDVGAFSAAVSLRYGLWVAVLGGVAMIAGGLSVGRGTQTAPAALRFAPPIAPMAAPEYPLPWDTGSSAPPPGA